MGECPLCLNGELTLHTKERYVLIDSTSKRVPCHYYVCSGCGSEQADSELLKINKLEILEARRND